MDSWQSGIQVWKNGISPSRGSQKTTWGFRLGFKIAGMFSVANKAHRLLLLKM
jgi:hypothetical protein